MTWTCTTGATLSPSAHAWIYFRYLFCFSISMPSGTQPRRDSPRPPTNPLPVTGSGTGLLGLSQIAMQFPVRLPPGSRRPFPREAHLARNPCCCPKFLGLAEKNDARSACREGRFLVHGHKRFATQGIEKRSMGVDELFRENDRLLEGVGLWAVGLDWLARGAGVGRERAAHGFCSRAAGK